MKRFKVGVAHDDVSSHEIAVVFAKQGDFAGSLSRHGPGVVMFDTARGQRCRYDDTHLWKPQPRLLRSRLRIDRLILRRIGRAEHEAIDEVDVFVSPFPLTSR